jgi:hypothetical protein
MKVTFDPDLPNKAKALVALAFRNGPIEELHAGRSCSLCSGKPEVSQITARRAEAPDEVGRQCSLSPSLVARVRFVFL